MKPAPILQTLRALPGVAEAEQRDGCLWLRFDRGATSEQRDRAHQLVTGAAPRVRPWRLCEPQRTDSRTTAPGRSGRVA